MPLLMLCLLLSQAGSKPPVAPPPQPLAPEVAVDKTNLSALTDGQGHFIVYDGADPLHHPVFYGDGQTFYQLSITSSGANGTESWSLSFWDPRADRSKNGSPASVYMRDSGAAFEVDCGRTTTPLKPVSGDALKALLTARFLPMKWTRQSHQLLRDDAGTYYFVDRLRDEQHRDFRVFIGPRGKLKQVPLKDIVDDSKGTIYATKNGKLRLVANTANYSWIAGKVETKLIDVPLFENARMIYLDLGPYAGAQLGTPCDDLM